MGQDDDLRAIDAALGAGDPQAVRARLSALIGEQTRVSMLVGVAVGVELARELGFAEGEAPLAVTHHGLKEDH